jgi:hypothetical protein
MITIKMQENKFRLEINKEEWEFKDKFELESVLEKLLNFKDEFGRLK